MRALDPAAAGRGNGSRVQGLWVNCALETACSHYQPAQRACNARAETNSRIADVPTRVAHGTPLRIIQSRNVTGAVQAVL